MYLTIQVEEGCHDSHDQQQQQQKHHISVLSHQFPCQCYQLEFTRHYEVIDLLEAQTHEPSTESNLYRILPLFQERGWKAPWNSDQRKRFHDRETDSVSPIIQSPGIHYHRIYNLLAIDGHSLEQFMRLGLGEEKKQEPFSLMKVMEDYCTCYQVDMSKTFPSHANLMCNRVVGKLSRGIARNPTQAGPYMTAQQVYGHPGEDNDIGDISDRGDKEGRICLIDAPGEPFVYDNAVLHAENKPDNHNKQEGVEPDLVSVNDKHRVCERPLAKQVDYKALHDYRLIPVALLPLFLSFMPACYTRVNTILYECEMLESRIWNTFTDIANYQTYMTEQVEALAQNRRFMGFTYQCSHFASFTQSPQKRLLDQYERSLYENEILQLRLDLVSLKECAEKEIKRLRRTKPSDSTDITLS